MQSVYDDSSEIPENLREEYEEVSDGRWVLKLEGDHPAVVAAGKQVKSFRERNIALMKERDKLNEKLSVFGDLTPEEVETLRGKVTELEQKVAAGASGDTAKMREEIERTSIKPLREKLEAAERLAKEREDSLKRRDIESKLSDIGLKNGIAEHALKDFLRRGTEVFGLDGVAREGDSELYDDDQNPLSMESFVKKLATDAPHLFKPNKGGGAPGSGPPGAKKTISGTDPVVFGQNLEGIASGKVAVQ